MRSGSRCPAFYGEIPPMRWGILNDDGGYFYCITYIYPDSSLADLYDEVLMPKELREAHRANDRAVMRAYGFPIKMTEADCVAALMQMYEHLTAGK